LESKTKVCLPPDQIEALVHNAFGSGASLRAVTELTDGWFNTAYHLTLDPEGTQTVLKVGPPEGAEILSYEVQIMKAEVEVMQLVGTDQSIPVPEVYFADLTRTILPNDYYLMGFAPGMPWNKIRKTFSEEHNRQIGRRLGQINARINAFEGPAFGYYASGPRFERWPDAFRFMLAQLLADGARYGIELPAGQDELLGLFDRHAAHFAEVERPQLVHWDLWDGNVFVEAGNGAPAITGVVDFERALWGDPLLEFYFGIEGNAAFVEGYGQDLLSTRSCRVRRTFYDLYLDLVLIIEDGPRQYTDKSSVGWGYRRLDAHLAALSD
jgi:aminoglycoside phosphotransferase (APT) family kinase protein